MQTREITFGPIYRGRDVHQTPEGRSYNLTNVYRTRDGTLRKRPGYDLYKDFSSAYHITCIWANPLDTSTDGIIVARNSSGTNLIIDHLRSDGTVANQINASTANLLNNTIPSFAGITATRIGIAAGLDIIDLSGIPGSPSVATLTNGPAAVRQLNGLIMSRGYLMAAEGSTQLTYFNNNSSASFNTAADWRTYENNRKPDNAIAIFNVRDEILNLGYQTIEFAWLDGTTPWAEVDSSYIPYGVASGATNSPCRVGDDVYFISKVDGALKVLRVIGANHSLQEISSDIAATLRENSIPTITDGDFELWAYSVTGATFTYDNIPYYVLSDWDTLNGITLLYDTINKEWLRWGAYSGGIFTAFPFRSFTTPELLNTNTPTLALRGPYVLASTTAQVSKVYAIDKSFANDDDAAIRCELETGKITHGTMNQKRCEWYRFYVKRVDGGQFTLYVNDENQGYDAGEVVSLDPNETTEYTMAEVRNVGVYRSRQIKLVHSSATDDFELVRMEEGFTVLRS